MRTSKTVARVVREVEKAEPDQIDKLAVGICQRVYGGRGCACVSKARVCTGMRFAAIYVARRIVNMEGGDYLELAAFLDGSEARSSSS